MSVISLGKTLNLALSVKDQAASAAWYEQMLGFQTLYHADDMGWSELQTMTEGVTLGLGEAAEPTPGNCVPVFGVADLDQARGALEKVGVRFDGETEVIEGMVKIATFYDPDNNALMLAQDLSQGG